MVPLIILVNKCTNFLISLLGFDPKKDRDDGLDSEEQKSLVDLSSHKLSSNNQGMLKGILDLENITIEDIMIPRNEMQGIDLEEPINSVMTAILDSEYTRQPLYKGCLLYTSPSPRDRTRSRMPSSA